MIFTKPVFTQYRGEPIPVKYPAHWVKRKGSPHTRPRDIRFWEKVDRSNIEGCWTWLANLSPKGYGRFHWDMATGDVPSHRASWILNYGEIPDGLCICHHCDNPRCVRPDHLFLGTQKDNAVDRTRKGRGYIPPRKTHCIRGHAFSPENTLMGQGGRYCRECRRLYFVEFRRRARENGRTVDTRKGRRGAR